MTFPLWAAFGLLFGEFLAFFIAFDAEPLGLRSDAWRLFGPVGSLAVLAASAAIGAAIVVHADRLRSRQFLVARRLDWQAISLLAAHSLSVTALWWLSTRVFAAVGPPLGSPIVWLATWGVVALVSAALAVFAAVPPTRVGLLIRASSPAVAGGIVIGVGAWLAGQSSALLWWPLGPATLRAVHLLLGLLLRETVLDPAQALIGSQQFQVIIAPVCSGFEGIGLIMVFLGAYQVLARRELRFPQVLLLLPLGALAAWVANVVRLVVLILLGTFVSEELAIGGFHARAGWLFFCAVALSLVLLVQQARFFAREPRVNRLDHPTAAYLMPFLALVATSLVTGLATRYVDLLYGLRVAVALGVLMAYRRSYRMREWTWSWPALGAGLVAAVAFVLLAPHPAPAAVEAWSKEWSGLPGWARALWLTLRVVGSVLVVPVAEELAFRGYLLRRLVDRDFETVAPGRFSFGALMVSSVAFGAIHGNWLGGTIAGLLFGLAQLRGNSVGQAVFAHVVANAVCAVCVMGFGQWWLWV